MRMIIMTITRTRQYEQQERGERRQTRRRRNGKNASEPFVLALFCFILPYLALFCIIFIFSSCACLMCGVGQFKQKQTEIIGKRDFTFVNSTFSRGIPLAREICRAIRSYGWKKKRSVTEWSIKLSSNRSVDHSADHLIDWPSNQATNRPTTRPTHRPNDERLTNPPSETTTNRPIWCSTACWWG